MVRSEDVRCAGTRPIHPVQKGADLFAADISARGSSPRVDASRSLGDVPPTGTTKVLQQDHRLLALRTTRAAIRVGRLLACFSCLLQPRGGHAPFFAPSSGSNADLSPLTVDVGHFQMRRFGEPQSRRVTTQQNRPMFGILGAFDQQRGFLIGQHDGQFLRSFAEGDVLDGPRLAEGHFVQKA